VIIDNSGGIRHPFANIWTPSGPKIRQHVYDALTFAHAHKSNNPAFCHVAGEDFPNFVLLLILYWPPVMLGSPCTFTIGGGFHFPTRTSFFGAYKRMVRLNGPFGAGTQFDSLSLPGLSFWK
jgi:hypothetical protein